MLISRLLEMPTFTTWAYVTRFVPRTIVIQHRYCTYFLDSLHLGQHPVASYIHVAEIDRKMHSIYWVKADFRDHEANHGDSQQEVEGDC
jgi:hypothetical protein